MYSFTFLAPFKYEEEVKLLSNSGLTAYVINYDIKNELFTLIALIDKDGIEFSNVPILDIAK